MGISKRKCSGDGLGTKKKIRSVIYLKMVVQLIFFCFLTLLFWSREKKSDRRTGRQTDRQTDKRNALGLISVSAPIESVGFKLVLSNNYMTSACHSAGLVEHHVLVAWPFPRSILRPMSPIMM